MKTYVYYEENYGELQSECDNVTDICVFGSAHNAAKHFAERVKIGLDNGFVYDKCTDLLNDSVVDIGEIKKRLREQGTVNISMFFQDDENWNCWYDCNIQKKELIK